MQQLQSFFLKFAFVEVLNVQPSTRQYFTSKTEHLDNFLHLNTNHTESCETEQTDSLMRPKKTIPYLSVFLLSNNTKSFLCQKTTIPKIPKFRTFETKVTDLLSLMFGVPDLDITQF